MKLLISPTTVDEARLVAEAGCEIVDIKNVDEGSLGAQPPWVIRQIISDIRSDPRNQSQVSVAIGDLPNKPGTISLAAYGAAQLAPNYIKAGLRDATCLADTAAMSHAMVKGIRMVSDAIQIVISGYADYQRFGGVSEMDIITAANDSGADVVMLDTLIKDGKSLFDVLSVDAIKAFVDIAHQKGLQVALAGSISMAHIDQLKAIGPDIIGLRGAVCHDSDRSQPICSLRVRGLVGYVQSIKQPVG